MADPPRRSNRIVQRDGRDRIDAVVLGVRRRVLSDTYYNMLGAPWWRLVLVFAALYLVVNALFASVYLVSDGIEGAAPGSFADAFYFSVQTMATIGYGAMHPRNHLANALVTAQALLGLLGVALATGVLFAKFARPIAQLRFSDLAVIARRDGVDSLMFRVGNERRNHVVEASMKVSIVRNETTVEGETVRRWYELPLFRSTSPIFALTWTAVHPITADSPLAGATPESLAAQRAEIVVTLVGLDATLSATIHARHSYTADEVVFGGRFVDILMIGADGRRVIDFRRFHEIERTGGGERRSHAEATAPRSS